MKAKTHSVLILIFVTVLLLWWQARQPIWNTHLQVDIWVFWERIEYWIHNHHSFAGLTGNEVLPTTLLYIFLPIYLIPVGWLSYTTYLPAMLIVNAMILGLHYIFVENKKIFLLSLLFLGPILLFRFDGLVTLFMLMAFVAFTKEKYPHGGFLLGLATGMKVFPVIFVPYLCFILLRKKQLKGLAQFLVFFAEALLLPVVIFFLMGGNLEQVSSALAFHSHKLISIESLPGSLITGAALLFKGHPPAMLPGNGIWAVAGPADLFNLIWVIPVMLLYFIILMKANLLKKFNWKVPLVIMLLFLIFSKNLNPQYMWWYMVLLPFVKPGKLVIILTLVAALLNQLVFPVFYTTFTQAFYLLNQAYWIYFLLLLRNICLVIITMLSLRSLLYDQN